MSCTVMTNNLTKMAQWLYLMHLVAKWYHNKAIRLYGYLKQIQPVPAGGAVQTKVTEVFWFLLVWVAAVCMTVL